MVDENNKAKIDKIDFEENEEVEETFDIDSLQGSGKETEIDELDLDELIEETEDQIKEDVIEETTDVSHETVEPEKPKKKIPFKLIFIVLLSILIILFSVLIILELRKKPKVISGYLIINKKIVWISKSKIKIAEKEQEIKKYNFNLKLAYEFKSVNGMKILSANIFTKFSSKASIPMDKLYAVIKDNIYKSFDNVTKDKFVEDIPNFKTKISEIIINDILNDLKNFVPDINIKEAKKNINFITFKID